MPATIVFYISGHGFGHASRSIEVINALVDRRPDLKVVIRSSVTPWLVALTARPGVELETVEVDTGVAQLDSLELDEEETIRRARAFLATWSDRRAAEGERLRALDARMTISDLPPLGVAAAARAGLPAVALGNFTWDWIYAGYAGSDDVVAAIADVYAATTLALRLPMWGGFETMPLVHDIPFVARRSERPPDEVRQDLALPLDRPLVLISFGGHGTDRIDLKALATLGDYHFVECRPAGHPAVGTRGNLTVVDQLAMYTGGIRYEDLLRAADVVATKPGYGVIAECIANGPALLYTSRGHFVEYDVLVREMPRYLRCAYIEQADLLAGRWADALDRLLSRHPPPERPAVNGADVAAKILLDML